ncbi:MAG: CHAT domain-containing protein [Candidatus Doudnabacteria bacterium]|nr:CHAT domain-containing protein [Candidatus Doudnabacteria bacterium]
MSLLSAIEQNPAIVTQYAINDLLEQYLVASLNDKPEQAYPAILRLKRIGQIISETKKDYFVLDLADFAARASPRVKSGILSVHLKLRQADKEFSRSSHDSAFKSYQSSLIAAKHIGDELHAEIATSSLIRYSYNRANSHSLISLGNRLITQAEKHRHRQVQAITHAALANAYLASQQGTPALENSLRAVTIAKEIGDRETLINALIMAGSAYTRSGNYALGISKSFEVLSILNNYPTGLLRSFQAYQQLWEPLFRLGNHQLALDYQKEALHTATLSGYTPGIIGTIGRIGLNQWKLDHKVEAENYLRDAIVKCNTTSDKTLRQLLQAELYTALGDVLLSLGKTNESLTSYSSALDAIKASNNSVYLSAIHQGLASAYLAQNEYVMAEEELQKSISFLEKSRQNIYDAKGRSVFLSRSQNAYKAMIDLQYYIKHNEYLAFDYAEVARNRNVLDALTGSPSLKKSDGMTVLSVSNNSNPLTLKEVQKRMPANIQLLTYALTEKGLIIWLVTFNSIYSTHVDVSAKDLEENINEYSTKLRKREDLHLINSKSSQLFNILILPVLDRLDTQRPLYIVQDGILSQLPFSSLYSSSTNRYVVEDYPIVTNHSVSILIKTQEWATSQQKSNNESFLGVSNPRFSYNRFHGLRSLPSAEDEVNNISALYERFATFSRDKATESMITQQIRNYNVIHLATHTLNYEADSLASTILLAEESTPTLNNKNWKGITYDGAFQASEIYSLKLPETKIVILSSCRSGLGNVIKGEATGALAQAFLAIRVPTVVASLWDIDDEASSDFMYLVHQNHRVKSLSFAESIRQVQRSFIYSTDRARRHPYFWAVFQISGAGSY